MGNISYNYYMDYGKKMSSNYHSFNEAPQPIKEKLVCSLSFPLTYCPSFILGVTRKFSRGPPFPGEVGQPLVSTSFIRLKPILIKESSNFRGGEAHPPAPPRDTHGRDGSKDKSKFYKVHLSGTWSTCA